MSLFSHNGLRNGLEWQSIAVGTALFTAGLLARGFISPQIAPGIIESPRKTIIPSLSDKEKADLAYRLDSFPGARDVDSPYGSIRVYEYGPEDGRKVLFVHGISTPCMALKGVANALVERGCRVMLFDLFGRGFSDTPTDLPHDVRLYTTQILLALSSSPISWTGAGTEGFSLIGYSLGGGIGTAFYSYFPHLVTSLVIIAPAGLIRDRHISRSSRFLYSRGVIPEPLLLRLAKRRLQVPMFPPKENQLQEGDRVGATDAMQAEVGVEGGQDRPVASSPTRNIAVEQAVGFQVNNHNGFVPAFMSSIRYGPIQRQHTLWQRVGTRLTESTEKVLIILGESDPIINLDEIREDATQALEGNVEFVVMDAGHEAPVTRGAEVADHIWKYWSK